MRVDGDLRRLFRRHMPDFFWTSVENGPTSPGTPDSHYAIAGLTGWVEFKRTDASRIASLTPEQVAWHDRYARCGGRSHLAVRRRHEGGPRRGPPIDELWLVPGALARVLRRDGLLELPSSVGTRLSGGPARWDWDAVRAEMVRG